MNKFKNRVKSLMDAGELLEDAMFMEGAPTSEKVCIIWNFVIYHLIDFQLTRLYFLTTEN